MKISIMQPYFLPYIGYWQLLTQADRFVVYDNIEYTKKGWISRNRFCEGETFSLSLEKSHDYYTVIQRCLSADWPLRRDKILRKIRQFYKNAPNFYFAYPLVEDIFLHQDKNLFGFIFNSLLKIRNYLMVATPITISSELPGTWEKKGVERVIETCKRLGPEHVNKTYVNPIGGTELYCQEQFTPHNIKLQFLRTRCKEENCLSIIDLLFRFHREQLIAMLSQYEIVEAPC